MISEERLRISAEEAALSVLESISRFEAGRHDFSLNFDLKISRLTGSAFKKIAKKTLRIAAIIAISLSVTCAGVIAVSPEARATVTSYWHKIIGDDGWPTYANDELKTDGKTADNRYCLSWVPDGYELLAEDEDMSTAEYGNGKEFISFSYTSESLDFLSAVECKSYNVCVNGASGTMYVPVENEYDYRVKTLIFEKSGVLFTVSADLSDSDLIKIAENIKMEE